MPHFPRETAFVASGPDFAPEVIPGEAPKGAEGRLADLLREYGPEAMTVYAQNPDGNLEKLTPDTKHTGRDDVAKYFITIYASERQGSVDVTGWHPMTIEIGWDS